MHRTQRIHSIPLERDSFSTQRFVILHAYAMLLKYALATHLQTHFRRFPMNYRLRQQQTTQHNTTQSAKHTQSADEIFHCKPIANSHQVQRYFGFNSTIHTTFPSPSPTCSGAAWHRLADIERVTMHCFSATLCDRFAAIRRAHCKPGSHACPPPCFLFTVC
jgi:hypothetical protein